MNSSRRDLIARGLAFFGASALSAWFPGSVRALSDDHSEPEGLIWYSHEYVTAETPVKRLRSWITSVPDFYIRNNLLMPTISLEQWRLRVVGEVERPFELSLAELKQLPRIDVTNTLECAGNGRAFFQPRIDGVRWGRGAVGNAVFSGPSLRNLLEKARVKARARHVAFKGMDLVPAGAQDFVRSIPIDKAMEPNTLIALRMNGEPLTPEHGFPARALVPGWIGSCSIKWLSEIWVLKDEFSGFYMQSAYRLPDVSHRTKATRAITSLKVKSIFTSPMDGASVATGETVQLQGAAWAGENAIAKVEVRTDGQAPWYEAKLGPEHSRYAWRFWSFAWKPAHSKEYVLQARATDTRGEVQPLRTEWNPSGYLWNGIDRLRVVVRAT